MRTATNAKHILILTLLAMPLLANRCGTVCQEDLNVTSTSSARLYYPCDMDSYSEPLPATSLIGPVSGTSSAIAWLAKKIANAEYVVITAVPTETPDTDFAYRQAHVSCIDKFRALNGSHPSLMGKVDLGRLQLMGLDQGGQGALLAAAQLESDIMSTIAITPYDNLIGDGNLYDVTSAVLLQSSEQYNLDFVWGELPDFYPKAHIQYEMAESQSWAETGIDRTRLAGDIIAWMKYYLEDDLSQESVIANTSGTVYHVWDQGGIPDCPSEAYADYFADNPSVAAASIDTFDVGVLSHFCIYVDQLETSGSISIAEPIASQDCIEPDSCINIVMTGNEARQVLAAKTAHSIWLDRNQILPWRLADYTQEELGELFDPEVVFDGTAPRYRFFSVVDYSPSDIYTYVLDNNLIGTDILDTFHNVLNDFRTTSTHYGFFHGAPALHPVDTAYPLYDALTTYTGFRRISRRGCHSMTRIMLGVLRNMNIPGRETTTEGWYEAGHSSAVWSVIQSVMPHGDDIYTGGLHEIPTPLFLPTFDFYTDPDNVAVCGSDKYCLSRRHRSLLITTYPAQWDIERCCDPVYYGYESCSAYLREKFTSFLTEEEMVDMIQSVESRCE